MLLPPQLSIHHGYDAAWNAHEADFEMLRLTVQGCRANQKWWWFYLKCLVINCHGSGDASEKAQMFAELGQSRQLGEVTLFATPVQAVRTYESKFLGVLLTWNESLPFEPQCHSRNCTATETRASLPPPPPDSGLILFAFLGTCTVHTKHFPTSAAIIFKVSFIN